MQITKSCISCKQIHHLTVSDAGYQAWRNGAYIQNAMPELSDDQRELLISGLCGKCFDELFEETEEE